MQMIHSYICHFYQLSHKAVFSIQKCLDEIKSWMYSNKLKLSESKTDCIVIGNTKQIDKVTCDVLKVGVVTLLSVKMLKTWGCILTESWIWKGR